jgi:hypothetical protein
MTARGFLSAAVIGRRQRRMAKLGEQIDRIYLVDAKIDEAEAVVRELKQRRAKLETRLLRAFDKEVIDGCKGRRGVARIRRARFPSIKDRTKFDKFVLKHRALDLFQNRISSTAYFARLEEGQKVPGITIFERIGVSITKRKS